jgi:DoxX-like protein
METAAAQSPTGIRFKTWIVWAGRVVSIAPVYILLWSARAKLTHSPWYVREWTRIGWSPDALNGVGAIQVTCLALYLIPQTAILGAVLLTGYLGGAIATYVRMGEFYPPLVPLTTCLLAWLGIFLRDERLRVLLPFRRSIFRT